MAIGGQFNLQGHKNPISVERNTHVSMYTEGTNKNASYISIYDGNNATGLDQKTNTADRVTQDGDYKTNNSEFAQGDSLGKQIFDAILGLDGNKDNLTTKDLEAVNKSWLSNMFGNQVKLNSQYNDKSGVVDISYNVGDATRHLYINVQTKNESKTDQRKQENEFNKNRRNDIKKGYEKTYQNKLNEKFCGKYKVDIEVGNMIDTPKMITITVNKPVTLGELRNDFKCDEKSIINSNPGLKSKKVAVSGLFIKHYSYDPIEIPAGMSIKVPTEQMFKNEES